MAIYLINTKLKQRHSFKIRTKIPNSRSLTRIKPNRVCHGTNFYAVTFFKSTFQQFFKSKVSCMVFCSLLLYAHIAQMLCLTYFSKNRAHWQPFHQLESKAGKSGENFVRNGKAGLWEDNGASRSVILCLTLSGTSTTSAAAPSNIARHPTLDFSAKQSQTITNQAHWHIKFVTYQTKSTAE